jgi:hypothetical protein
MGNYKMQMIAVMEGVGDVLFTSTSNLTCILPYPFIKFIILFIQYHSFCIIILVHVVNKL